MTRPLNVHLPLERAYVRNVLFAVELLDAATLARVMAGLTVTADGLHGRPIVNTGGLFVWLEEDIARLQKIVVDPGLLPYQVLEIPAGELLPLHLTTRLLQPRIDYPFTRGITALRGSLIEDRLVPRVPLVGAAVGLQWLDEDQVTWRDASTAASTDERGDFAAILRFTPADQPFHDANGALTARVRARRSTLNQRHSDQFPLWQGRVADPPTFVWDEMYP